MASHGMTPGRDLLHEPRVLLGKPSHDEHRRGHAIGPQRVQNADCRVVPRADVEHQRHLGATGRPR